MDLLITAFCELQLIRKSKKNFVYFVTSKNKKSDLIIKYQAGSDKTFN